MNAHDEQVPPSADGILQCLRCLAKEAAALKLSFTSEAIELALAMIAIESGHGPIRASAFRAAGVLLH